MKRLLEWKQRMLQSPLTRKNAPGSGSGRTSERSTPTLAADRDAAASPRLINRLPSPVQGEPRLSLSPHFRPARCASPLRYASNCVVVAQHAGLTLSFTFHPLHPEPSHPAPPVPFD